MKKLLILLIPFLLLSCGSNKSTDISEINTNTPSNETLTYSNLGGKTSKTELKKILHNSGIDDVTIDDFYKDVDYYNKIIKKTLNPIDDFINSNSYSPNYDIFDIKDTWSSKEPDFLGYNSRITTLNLLKNFIKVNNTLDSLDTSNLVFDLESLKSAPKTIFSDDNYKFKNIFAQLTTSKTSNINTHINNIKSMFDSRGIQFTKDAKSPSMISVFTHNTNQTDDSTLSIVHTGVLVEYKKKLYFIEKLGFSEPYRVDIFDDRDGLINYLMNMYSVYKTTSSSDIIIFENDDIIDGYLNYISNLG